jgi:hypothetical protein
MKLSRLESYKRVRKSFKRSPGTQIHKDKRKKSRQEEKIILINNLLYR